jgi:predicted O-methyltransferase YrrM
MVPVLSWQRTAGCSSGEREGPSGGSRAALRCRGPPARSTPRRPAIDAGETSQPEGKTPGRRGAAASTDPGTLAAWLDGWLPEDAPLLSARARAAEVGIGAVDPATGAVLRMLAAVSSARAAVEVGTGAGVSTLWILRGMRPDGILTSVDSDGEHQRLARLSLGEAGVPAGRVRLIAGRAMEVLPRLSDGAYDLVFCDASRAENDDYLEAAIRLLRPGGVVAFAGALGGGRIAEASARDPETVALRELVRRVREEPRLVPALVPVGPGLLVASTVLV